MNDANDVIFEGRFNGNGSGRGLWLWSGDAATLLFRTGDIAPGTNGIEFDSFSSTSATVLNNNGDLAFRARLDRGGTVDRDNDDGVWLRTTAGTSLLVRSGSPLPEMPSGSDVVSRIDRVLLNDAGTAVVYASLRRSFDTARTGRGIWSFPGATPTKVISNNDPAPGVPGGIMTEVRTPSLNDAGDILFTGDFVQGPGDTGLWIERDGVIDLLVRGTDAAPGVPGATVGEIFSSLLNDRGDIVFSSLLGGMGTPAPRARWAILNGVLTLIAVEGGAAPQPGTEFANLNSAVPTPTGAIVFDGVLASGIGGVTADNDRGVWRFEDGSAELVVREGDPAPPQPGVIFDLIFLGPVNTAGDTVTRAQVRDEGVPFDNDTGLALVTADGRDGRFLTVTRRGDPFDASRAQDRSDLRTPISIGFSGASIESGAARLLSEEGIFAFTLTFEDRSRGVFLSSVRQPCSIADLAVPFGILNASDINSFVAAFLEGSTRVDFAVPFGILNASDINAVVNALLAGCS
ncbi:MAG: choice-of-anchor tandem repeat NxxGxxAF-containing protein [Pseudomonadota bacterium]